jgi:hypothetical protein
MRSVPRRDPEKLQQESTATIANIPVTAAYIATICASDMPLSSK